ncbi:villin putative [Euphorbia peplus]|nr:villin putative [Euphorbia peplus]
MLRGTIFFSYMGEQDDLVLSFFPLFFYARLYEGSEPIQFSTIFQSLIIFKGGLSSGYKNIIAEKELPDETYQEDGVALFRVQGSGPDNQYKLNRPICKLSHRKVQNLSNFGTY